MERLRSDERFSQERLNEFTAAAKCSLPCESFGKLSEEDLTRFIVAREGNVDAALKQLMGAVAWADSTLVEPMSCELCLKDPTSHSHIPIGVEQTKEKSTIMYGCPARATNAAVDPIVNHVGRQLEHCFALTATGSRWIWCVDYNGFGFKHAMQGKLAASFGKLFSNTMPERLHKVILLNPPSVFRMLLAAAKPFVDKRTLDKLVAVTGSTDKVIQQLREEHDFPAETLTWLEEVLNQELPATLPALPKTSRALMLPSLVPVFHFERVQTKNPAATE